MVKAPALSTPGMVNFSMAENAHVVLSTRQPCDLYKHINILFQIAICASRKCSLPLLMSSSCGSGEGLSFKGEVLGPTGGFVGALNGIGGGGGGGGGGCDGCGGRVGCCSIRAWILLLPSALK